MADGTASYKRYLMGESNALEDLLRIYGDALIRFAYSFLHDVHSAEDVMDECFVVLLAKRRDFSGEQSLKAFLFKTARNKCVDVLRKRKKVLPLDERAAGAMLFDAEEEALLSEKKRALYKALQTLPEGYGDVLKLVYLEGFTIEETAAILHKSKKQVYNLLSRARASLRGAVSEEVFL